MAPFLEVRRLAARTSDQIRRLHEHAVEVTEPRSPVQESADIRELAACYGAAWAKRDLDAIMAMHTENTIFHMHGGGEAAIGSAATRAAFAAGIAQYPDIRFERKRVHIGESHFVSEYELSATMEGRRILCDGVDIFAVEDGLVARKDTYLDWPAIQQQLAPQPGPTPA